MILSLLLYVASMESQEGKISFYEGRGITASGEAFDEDALTVASKTLPFNTLVLIYTDSSAVICRVNDRGPFIRGRHLDVSRASMRVLRSIDAGVIRARYIALGG